MPTPLPVLQPLKSKKAGIPVILINREIPVDDVALVQITHNNFQAGSEVANAFVEKMGEKENMPNSPVILLIIIA